MKRIALIAALLVLMVGCLPSPVLVATPNVVVITSPPIEVTREVQVTRVVPATPLPATVAPTVLPTYMATEPVVQFTDITWTRDAKVPRICINQGVAFKMVLEGKPGLDVVYHINHYDGAGVKTYRSKDFAGTIEADGKLVKSFQESFTYQSKWRVQLVITWPLPLVTRNASITVDCN